MTPPTAMLLQFCGHAEKRTGARQRHAQAGVNARRELRCCWPGHALGRRGARILPGLCSSTAREVMYERDLRPSSSGLGWSVRSPWRPFWKMGVGGWLGTGARCWAGREGRDASLSETERGRREVRGAEPTSIKPPPNVGECAVVLVRQWPGRALFSSLSYHCSPASNTFSSLNSARRILSVRRGLLRTSNSSDSRLAPNPTNQSWPKLSASQAQVWPCFSNPSE